jgi:hypothetical protein
VAATKIIRNYLWFAWPSEKNTLVVTAVHQFLVIANSNANIAPR